MVLSATLIGCEENPIDNPNIDKDFSFELVGETEINFEKYGEYVEKGFIATIDGEDASEFVTIDRTELDVNRSGDYTLRYTLEKDDIEETLTRMVYVREQGCYKILGTDTTECSGVWSNYLHTYVSLKLYYDGDAYNDRAQLILFNVENILAKYTEISDKYKSYTDVVNVYTINQNPTATHTIDPDLFDLIKFSLDHQDEVNNLFNIALGPVLEVWHDYREDCLNLNVCNVPNASELTAQSAYINPDDITLDEANYTITMKENMSLDLGGVSKGYVSREITEYLDSLDLSGYLLNNGESNISIGGDHPTRDNDKFLLAVTDPTFELQYYATVYLSDGDQLVTSGDYQKYYIVDGEVYHHIIHNETFMPERYSRSVSIVTSDAALADIYSTAIFMMPISEGKTFVNSIDGLEAIWYGLDGEIHFSANFEALYLHNTYE
jgi:thiamine biosynthesis lipoprotein